MDQDSAALLTPGERLLWEGRPDPEKHLAPGDVFLIPFHALFMVFVIVFITLIINTRPPLLAMIILGVFVLVGLYALVGRFFVKYLAKLRTTYVLTDRRAIIRGPWSTRDVWLASALVETRLSRSGAHLSVIFRSTGSARGGRALTQQWGNELLRNTGIEGFASGLSPAFYDIADVHGLQQGLRTAYDGRDSSVPPYGT